jgi:hypothetical protein
MDIEQLAGTRLDNYKIENLLGRGGICPALCRFRFTTHIKSLTATKTVIRRFHRFTQIIAGLGFLGVLCVFAVQYCF